MILKEWNKVKNVFKKPKMRIYFGFWSTPYLVVKLGKYLYEKGFDKHPILTKIWKFFSVTDPSLPVWRRGNTISLFKRHSRYTWNGDTKNECYEWNDDFKRTLKMLHLSWLKPTYTLPSFLSFYIFSHDVIWKTKYTEDDIRYEFPPQFTIVLFNISLTFHWHAPVKGNSCSYDDTYWESLLHYVYNKKMYNTDVLLPSFIKDMGLMRCYHGKNEDFTYEWTVLPEFFKNKLIQNRVKDMEDRWIKEQMERNDFLKCTKCGGKMHIIKDVILTTYPPQYEYKCEKCGSVKYSFKRYDDTNNFEEGTV